MAGPDIFLSYNREDAVRAKHFAEAFSAEGFDVWWDATLRSGEAYDEVTEEALANARAVVVLWSPRSVVSRWVRAEATEAERNKTLLPVMIEPCKRPIMFELLQTAELEHWHGDQADPAWLDFLRHVADFVGKDAKSGNAADDRPPISTLQTSIIVLPFANMSADPEQEYFADGISEDIITDLSKVSALMVIARNTAFTFKGKHVDICKVARDVGVTHVLEGSVRKAGNRVRVTAQLIDGATGGHVWAERYDRELSDIFEIQDELSEAIVGALKVKLLPTEKESIEDRATRNADAYDFYLRARALRATMHHESLRRAVLAYREALDLDPDFALAWAGLATLLNQQKTLFSAGEAASEEEIDHAFTRAFELAPDLPDMVAAKGQKAQFERDWKLAEECIDYFVSRNDYNWSVCSNLMLALGRANAAVGQQEKVLKEDPLSLGASWVLQHCLDCAGRHDEAEKLYKKSKSLAGNIAVLDWLATTRRMAQHKPEDVFEIFHENHERDLERQPFGPELAKIVDQPDKALDLIRRIAADPENQVPIRLASIAHWAEFYGDCDLAIDILGLGSRIPGFIVLDMWHNQFSEIRRDARFKTILLDCGLADHWRKTGNWGDFARHLGDDDFEVTG